MSDLSDDEEQQVRQWMCHVISAPAVHKAGVTPITSRRRRDCEVQDESWGECKLTGSTDFCEVHAA